MPELYIKKDNIEYRLNELMPSAHLLEMHVGSPQPIPDLYAMRTRDGSRLNDLTFGPQAIVTKILLAGDSMEHFYLLKSELMRLFYNRGLVRIRSSDEPAKSAYVIPNPVEVTPFDMSSTSVVELEFQNLMGYRVTPFESTELLLHADKLQFGMNLDLDNLPKYTFNGSAIKVFNPSDVAIDPYIHKHDLRLVLNGVSTDTNFTIKNETTKTSITINSQLKLGDEFVLNQTLATVNGNANLKTDFGHISLAKGWNDIKVVGVSNVKLEIKFPFLYF
ncbi:phage tail family protein [Weissella ceti]|uniref:Phage tail family protein n=1 Tax=Weissella ceti TaxID=759620 RepID=A0ABT3E3K6_9LACO|nr:phage tail domain-containing protein [Weissella ceti]MCW0953000.1 phage tail family protein [Weissella ceti]QVK11546.1 phage tail family protein [Weissella ceti]